MNAPLPPDEEKRLATLRSYEILDTSPEQAYDDLTLLAAQICQAPLAQISLVDKDRQWFKSHIGSDTTETPRDISFCTHTILHKDEVMEIKDARADPRFASSPLVTADPHIRYYAGAPLVAPDGHALGALCVMDRNVRTLSAEQLAALRALGRHVVAQLELRRQARDLRQEAAAREDAQRKLREQFDQLAASQRETSRLLGLAEKSRRALLSVLEDEKLAGQNLRESEERFRQLAENINEVFWMTDPTKNTMLYISPAYETIWGRTCESLYATPLNWVEALHPEDRSRVLEAASTKQSQGTYDESYRIVRPDGAVRSIHDRAFPVMDSGGKVIRIVGVAEDITERKKLEEQFLQAQRMEAIGMLASGVAHDLNNILAPMLMGAALLKEKTVSTKEREMLSMIERSGQRGADIIRQLLSFSRVSSGERITVQAKHLIRDMMDIMRETFPRNITIVEPNTTDLWTVEVDPTQLHQVVMNLCVNARDAMPSGGTLTVESANVAVDETSSPDPALKPGSYLMLAVKDTGHGIPPEIINRIFEPFFTTKEVGKGTGLGLSTVVTIIKAHGGLVKVFSEPGRGTAFRIYLPASGTMPGTGPVGPSERFSRGRGELVLVVDDEAPIRDATRGFLEASGYRVLLAGSGEEGLRLIIDNLGALRLVLTDMMMPGMDGLALIRALRMLESDIKVIVTSGLAQGHNRDEFSALGVADVLMKPSAPEVLLKTIGTALAK